MLNLDFQFPPGPGRETATAEKHLAVWTWSFYSAAIAMGLLGGCAVGGILLWGRSLFSGAVGWCSVFFAAAISFWAAAARCTEYRRVLRSRDMKRYSLAIRAFKGILVVSMLALLAATIATSALTTSGDAPAALWLFPAVIVVFMGLVAWTHERLCDAQLRSPTS